MDALHNNVFRNAKSLSQSREPYTSVFRFGSKANGTGTLRQFVSKATRPKLPGGLLLSRLAACLVQGTAERAEVPEIDLSRPDRKASATPLSSKFATQSVSEPQQPRPFASCWWNLGTTYRRQALFVCEGLPASPPIPRQGTLVTSRMEVEECPRSSYHAGRGH
jgi:hypothetical protein